MGETMECILHSYLSQLLLEKTLMGRHMFFNNWDYGLECLRQDALKVYIPYLYK